MKTLLLLITVWAVLNVNGQTLNDQQVFRINTSGLQSFRLYNMNGPVNIQGVDGNEAILKVSRKLTSLSAARIEEMKASITYDSITVDDKVYFFMKHPDVDFEIDEYGNGHYNSCCDRKRDRNYVKVKYEFEIDLQVPKQMELHVSTHRKALKIKGISGNLVAKNHHNDLFAEDLSGKNVKLRTHHGDIKASFIQNPTEACSYATHHGDIRVEFRRGLAVNVLLKSHHGDFFTDFDWTPQALAVAQDKSKNGTKYVVNDRTAVRIGAGGPEQSFKTWHGDIYLIRGGQ